MVRLKQAIRALKTNIEFIENMPPRTFSDFAIAPKIKQLNKLKEDLDSLYNTPNTLDEQTYISFNNKLYGNLIIQISNICDRLKIEIDIKEKIIEKIIQICNCLLSFIGISIGLNIAYYKFYGQNLVSELLNILPDNIKKEIIQVLYTFLSVVLIAQMDSLYGACSNIKGTIINIINLFRNQVIQLSNRELILPEIEEQPEMIIEMPPSSQESIESIESNLSGPRYFEEKCTIGIDVDEFDKEYQIIFNNLNEKLAEINNIDDNDFKRVKSTRKKMSRSKSRSRSRDRPQIYTRRRTPSRGGKKSNKKTHKKI
jgi:hypothetical protein